MTWDPALYLAFRNERTRPAFELAARVTVVAPVRVMDLGCGPGNSTAILRERWPDAQIDGLDADPAMIETAMASDPRVRWLRADANTWAAVAEYDVVFSNALLQWLPKHEELLPRLFHAVRPGGALAVQIPAHLGSAVQRDIRATADEPRWRTRTAHAREALEAHEPAFYYDALCPLASRLDVWLTEYQHVLTSPNDILNWMRGTGLRPFLAALPIEEHAAFEADLLARLEQSYPRRRDGRVLFPFRRLFAIAYR